MPLFIDNSLCPNQMTVGEFLHAFPQFKKSSEVFLKQDITTIGPKKLLYIGQREIACATPNDNSITYLGSEDATTCHIAIMRHSESGVTSLIHFDGCQTEQGLALMADSVYGLSKTSASGRLELHLFGGFLDDKKNSKEVSDSILTTLHKINHDIHLITACITHHNTVYQNSVPFPVIYGMAVNVKTGDMFQATFPDKGPDVALRSARHFSSGAENLSIYDPINSELVIPPFHYDTFEEVEQFLSLPDNLIRKFMSTSPKQEKEGFAQSIRASLTQLRDFPDPLRTVFTDGLPRRYKKDCTIGAWVKIELSQY